MSDLSPDTEVGARPATGAHSDSSETGGFERNGKSPRGSFNPTSEREFPVVTAPRKDSVRWTAGTTTTAELIESMENPADHKECGNYLLGKLSGDRRVKEAIISRSMLAADADSAEEAHWDRILALPFYALVHTTYSSFAPKDESGGFNGLRLRLIVPLDREVTPDEYTRLVRWVMDQVGVEAFDPGSLQAERFMFAPSAHPKAREPYRSAVVEGPILDVDAVLAEAPSEDVIEGDIIPPRDDAREIPGMPGVVASVYSVEEIIEEYALPYDRVSAGRWHYRPATGSAGLTLGRGYGYAVSGHTSDPAYNDGRRVTAFDMVRLHRFGDLDRDVPEGTPYAEMPSQVAARELFAKDPRVAEKLAESDDDTAPTSGGRGGREPLPVTLREHVLEHFDVFTGAADRRVFARPKSGGRAELVTGGFVIRAARDLGRRSGSLSSAATEAAKVLGALAEEHEPRTLSLRADYQPGRIVLDLGQHGSGRCVVVTEDGTWRVEETPPEGVIFLAPGLPLPTPERGGHVEELRELLRWSADDPRWALVKGWLPASLLASIPRPMLGIFGPQGSAKTTTGRYVVGTLDPKPAGVLGGGFGKNRADDETKALKSYLPAWDNVAGISGEGADFLSRLVTGEYIEKRQLYTDADVVSIAYRRSGVITGLTVPRGMKPDTLDRFVLIAVEPLEGERLSEGTLEAEWERVHPRALAGVLDLAAGMLSRLADARGSNTAGLRMADYAEAVWAVDPGLYAAYAANVSTSRADMAADDPFISALVALLDDHGGRWEGTAEDARQKSEEHRTDPLDSRFWPKNGKAFSDEITRTSELLRAAGIRVERRRSNGKRVMVIDRVEEARR